MIIDTTTTHRVDELRGASWAVDHLDLLDAIAEHSFDACFGGARRDEDEARAEERVLSFRDAFGRWERTRGAAEHALVLAEAAATHRRAGRGPGA